VGLSDSPIASDEPLGGGINETRLVEHEDGTVGVWERSSEQEMMREVSAYLLDQAAGLGVVPKTVYGTDSKGRVGSVQQFVEGESGVAVLMRVLDEAAVAGASREEYEDRVAKELHHVPGSRRIGVLDFITGNNDRYETNIYVGGGRLHAIDNGASARSDKPASVLYNANVGADISDLELGKVSREDWDRVTFGGRVSWAEGGWSRLQQLASAGTLTPYNGG